MRHPVEALRIADQGMPRIGPVEKVFVKVTLGVKDEHDIFIGKPVVKLLCNDLLEDIRFSCPDAAQQQKMLALRVSIEDKGFTGG